MLVYLVINTTVSLEAFYHAEGRVFFTSSTQYRHEYAIKDHLGNIRLWVSDLNGDSILETPQKIPQESATKRHNLPFCCRFSFLIHCSKPQLKHPTQQPNFRRCC
ncbi:MAG: hypothetical protein R3E32_09230 [Chitinophagales bacterium]